ncbi:hypothetical protein DPMN_007187 [Dreissena polymorpha]|uniref:Uncharacterized protein n=1 Tax=Dreissena polymorpha TaxID=45954 RepID=A0A9D4MT97_DREPO|nr:hypothetical protein DPMN_007187 [Dreissena polymorpha]
MDRKRTCLSKFRLLYRQTDRPTSSKTIYTFFFEEGHTKDASTNQRLQEKAITVEDNTILSPGHSRFATTGRPARTMMIRSEDIFNAVKLFPGADPVEAGQQPGRVPVNPDWLRLSRSSPGCRR